MAEHPGARTNQARMQGSEAAAGRSSAAVNVEGRGFSHCSMPPALTLTTRAFMYPIYQAGARVV